MLPDLKKSHGFTLIELMIVMVITALLMGVVGPLAFKSLERVQAKAELFSLSNTITKAGQYAFTHNQSIIIRFAGRELKLITQPHSRVLSTRNLEFLFFQPQDVSISKSGLTQSQAVKAMYKGGVLTLNVKTLLTGTKQQSGEFNE
jgi:prepilin-type N-terminal cleavage/methylation domain-containing protein